MKNSRTECPEIHYASDPACSRLVHYDVAIPRRT
jgi:hypothetical protein